MNEHLTRQLEKRKKNLKSLTISSSTFKFLIKCWLMRI